MRLDGFGLWGERRERARDVGGNFDGSAAFERRGHEYLFRAEAGFAVATADDIDADRTPSDCDDTECQRDRLAHLARPRKLAVEFNDRQADAALRDHLRVVDAQAFAEPVFDQRVGHHQVLRKEHDARGVAVREANAYRLFEGGRAHFALSLVAAAACALSKSRPTINCCTSVA